MRHFLKLCEIVNEQGGVYTFDPVQNEVGGKSRGKWEISGPISDAFLEAARQCQPFVFSSENFVPIDMDLSMKAQVDDHLKDFQKLEPLDSPFEVFSIEMIDGPITSPRPSDRPIYIDCMMVMEGKATKDWRPQYWVIILSRYEDGKREGNDRYFVSVDLAFDVSDTREDGMLTIIKIDNISYLPNKVTLEIVRKFLDRLTNESAGAEKVNERIRVGVGKNRGLVKIKKVIHISPKKTEKAYVKSTGRQIEWSHRWFSRGHWRDLPPGKLGKNRDGVYCEVGRTWVTESIKGPEHKELITKVRVVENNPNPKKFTEALRFGPGKDEE